MNRSIVFICTILILVLSACINDGEETNLTSEPSISDANLIEIPNPTVKTTPATITPIEKTSYEKKLDLFVEAANTYDIEALLHPDETYNIYANVISRFSGLLEERESLDRLEDDCSALQSEQAGFLVKLTETTQLGGYSYRFVEITNKFMDKAMGAKSSLFLQFWMENAIECVRLLDSYTAEDQTYFVDYRFFEEERVISVIQRRHSDVVESVDLYLLFLFKVNSLEIINCVPDIGDGYDNGYWEVLPRHEGRFNSEQKITAVFIYELIEASNKEKTAFDITGRELTIWNMEKPESRIKLVLEGCQWKLSG